MTNFSEIGRLTERKTKQDTPYLTSAVNGVQVFVFKQKDGSFRVFRKADPGASADHPREQAEGYVRTLPGHDIPDPGEPVRAGRTARQL